jgi:hypothetical protein
LTLSQIESLALTRLGDNGTYYPGVLDAINEAQRLFCLVSLCLETSETFPLAANTALYNVLPALSGFVLARRIYYGGRLLRPASLAQLEAVEANWQSSLGTPARYALCGLDFLAVYPQTSTASQLTIVHVRPPVPLVNLSDVPEIRPASHWALASYAAWAVRQVEGGQEFAKFQTYFDEFMAEAQIVAGLVRQRTRDSGLEVAMPFELTRTKR